MLVSRVVDTYYDNECPNHCQLSSNTAPSYGENNILSSAFTTNKTEKSIRCTNTLLALLSARPVLLRLLPSIWVLIDKYSKCKYTLSNLGTLIFKFTLAHIHSLHMHTIMLIETNQCPLTQLINSHMNPIKVTRNTSPYSFIRHLETLC